MQSSFKHKALTQCWVNAEASVSPALGQHYTNHCAACARHRLHACIKMRTALPANRRLDPMLFHCLSSAVGGGLIVKQHWVKSSRLLGSTQVSVYTHRSPTIIFSPADQGTFSKTAGQSQDYYHT